MSFTRRHLASVALSCLLVVVGCRDEDPGPFILELRRDGDTLLVSPTLHSVTSADLEQFEKSSRHIEVAIENSSVVFLESNPNPSEADIDRLRSLNERGGPDPRQTRERIEDWSTERREEFLNNLRAYPGMNGQWQRIVLNRMPHSSIGAWAAREGEVAQLSLTESIESWVVNRAQDRAIPVLGLEPVWLGSELLNQNDQDEYLRHLEEFLRYTPTRAQITEIRTLVYQNAIRDWMAGTLVEYDTDRDVTANVLEIPEGAYYYQMSVEQHQLAIREKREEYWVGRLDEYVGSEDSPVTAFVAVGYSHFSPEQNGVFVPLLLDDGWEYVRSIPTDIPPDSFQREDSEDY